MDSGISWHLVMDTLLGADKSLIVYTCSSLLPSSVTLQLALIVQGFDSTKCDKVETVLLSPILMCAGKGFGLEVCGGPSESSSACQASGVLIHTGMYANSYTTM